MKRIAFLIGIGLLALAFLVTGGELAARGIGTPHGDAQALFIPLSEVWTVIAPASFADLQARFGETLWWWALSLPGWLLFGVPGLALVITCHKRDPDAPDRDYEDDLFLFDELAAAARKEGYTNHPDDMNPADPDDIVPADDHYSDPIEAELLPDRDFLLDPAKPAPQPPEQNDENR